MSSYSLSDLSSYIAGRMGLHFPRERWRDLMRGIEAAAPELGFDSKERCIEWLLSSPLRKDQIEILASYFTVGETYFFRDKHTFDALEQTILPELIRQRRDQDQRVRIWSAGCCSGEEAYSIAIQVSQLLPDLAAWNITILATDINPHFLQRASAGIYSEWSFRNTPSWVKERYFRKINEGRYEILDRLKKMVTFAYLNLAEDTYPSICNNTSAMDIILCRNVLMYFSPAQIKKVNQNFYRALVAQGCLIVSAVETSPILFNDFSTVKLSGAIVYKKTGAAATPAQFDGSAPCGDFRESSWMTQPITVEAAPQATMAPEPEPMTCLYNAASFAPVEHPSKLGSPSDPYKTATELSREGRYGESAELLVSILGAIPENLKAMVLLAKVYANQGRLDEAVEWCSKALAEEKLDPEVHYLLATILLEQAKPHEATRCLKRAIYLDQNLALAHFTLGNLYLHQKYYKASKKHFENALTILRTCGQEQVLLESEGITAGRLIEILETLANPKSLR